MTRHTRRGGQETSGQKRERKENSIGKSRLVLVLIAVITVASLLASLSVMLSPPSAAQTSSSCMELWSCTSWSGCVDNVSTRTCFDANSCGTTSSEPEERVSCAQATPYCFDRILNQDESDVDCGGSVCSLRCADGQRCYSGADCGAGVCINNSCSQAPQIPAPVRVVYANLNLDSTLVLMLWVLALVALFFIIFSKRRKLQLIFQNIIRNMNFNPHPKMNLHLPQKGNVMAPSLVVPTRVKTKISTKINMVLHAFVVELTFLPYFKKQSSIEKGLKKYLNTKKGYEFNPLATNGYELLNKVVEKIEVKREEKAIIGSKTMFKSIPQLSERKVLPFEKEVGSYLRRHDSAKLSPLVEPTRVVDSFVDKLKRFKVKTKRETSALLTPLKSRSKFDSELGGYLRKVDPSSTELKVVGKSPGSSSFFENSYSGSATNFKSRAELTTQKSSVLRTPQSKYSHQFLGIEEVKKEKQERKFQPMRMMEFAAKIDRAIRIPQLLASASIKPVKFSMQEKHIIGAKHEDKKKLKVAAALKVLDIPTKRTDGERQIFEEENLVEKKGLLKEKSFKKKNKAGAIKQWMVSELKEVYKD